MFLHQCELGSQKMCQKQTIGKNPRLDPVLVEHWNEVTAATVSLPDKMANLYGREVRYKYKLNPSKYLTFYGKINLL